MSTCAGCRIDVDEKGRKTGNYWLNYNLSVNINTPPFGMRVHPEWWPFCLESFGIIRQTTPFKFHLTLNKERADLNIFHKYDASRSEWGWAGGPSRHGAYADFNWARLPTQGRDRAVQALITHEIGHMLGLSHSSRWVKMHLYAWPRWISSALHGPGLAPGDLKALEAHYVGHGREWE